MFKPRWLSGDGTSLVRRNTNTAGSTPVRGSKFRVDGDGSLTAFEAAIEGSTPSDPAKF